MYIATHTITRHEDGKSKVTFHKGRTYTEEQMEALPQWYREYTVCDS